MRKVVKLSSLSYEEAHFAPRRARQVLAEPVPKCMAECFAKNMIDKDEYPQTAEIENRCSNMISRLFHAPDTGACVSTIGS